MKRSGRRIFLRVFASYMAMSLCSLLIISILYSLVSNTIMQESRKKNELMLSQVQATVDNHLGEAYAIMYYLETNSQLLEVLQLSPEEISANKYFKIYKLCNTLPKFNMINSTINDVYIVCRKNPYVIMPTRTRRLHQVPDNVVFEFAGPGWQKIDSFIWDREYGNEMLLFPSGQDGRPHIVLADSLSIGNEIFGVAMIHLKNEFIERLFSQYDIGKNGAVFVQDAEGSVIARYHPKDSAIPVDAVDTVERQGAGDFENDKKYLVTEVVSPGNLWRYVSIQLKSTAFSSVFDFQTIVAIMTALSLAFSAVISYFVTRNKAAALSHIIGMLDDDGTGREKAIDRTYQFIENGVSSLIARHNTLQTRMDLQRSLIQAVYLRKLMFHEYTDEKDLDGILNQLDPSLKIEKHVIAIAEIFLGSGRPADSRKKDPEELIMASVKDAAQMMIQNQCYILDIDKTSFAIMMRFPAELDSNSIELHVDALLKELRNDILRYDPEMDAKFSISDVNMGVEQIEGSMGQVREIAEKTGLQRFKVLLRKEDIPDQEDVFSFPLEEEFKLLQLLKDGNGQELDKLLQNIYTANFDHKKLSRHMAEMLLTAVKNTILRGIRDLSGDDDMIKFYEETASLPTDGIQFHHVYQAAMDLCKLMNKKKLANSENRKLEILDFMRVYASDPDFSIQNLSKHFFMSESSLYQYFRKHMRLSFYETLESIRIENACRLIKEGDVLIKNIALKVGFTNDISFRRSFKKVTGFSPSDYKKVAC